MKKIIAFVLLLSIFIFVGTNLTAIDVAQLSEDIVGATSSSRAILCELIYSIAYADLWDPKTIPKYNCYAYAIGITSDEHDPGYFSGQTYDHLCIIGELAEVIKDDLKVLGYNCIRIQNDCPNSIGIWENVIAVRKDTTLDDGGRNDYHVAKLMSDGWYHKPGNTAILKFKNAPSNDVAWRNELYYFGRYYPSTVTYDSPLRFILYKRNHSDTTYTWTGEHYHSGASHFYRYSYVCDGCGYSNMVWQELPCTGPHCNLPWSVNPDPVTE